MQNELGTGRFNGILSKLLNLKERSPSPVIGAEIIPAIILESDRPEFKFIGGEVLAMAGAESAAVAGQLSNVSLQNPAGSGVLLILEHIFMRSTGGAVVYGQVFSGTVAGTSTAVNTRDTRLAPNYVAGRQTGISGIVRFNSLAVSIITAAGYFCQAPNEWYSDDLVVVLGPGTYIVFENNTANNPLRISMRWRERVLEPAETR